MTPPGLDPAILEAGRGTIAVAADGSIPGRRSGLRRGRPRPCRTSASGRSASRSGTGRWARASTSRMRSRASTPLDRLPYWWSDLGAPPLAEVGWAGAVSAWGVEDGLHVGRDARARSSPCSSWTSPDGSARQRSSAPDDGRDPRTSYTHRRGERPHDPRRRHARAAAARCLSRGGDHPRGRDRPRRVAQLRPGAPLGAAARRALRRAPRAATARGPLTGAGGARGGGDDPRPFDRAAAATLLRVHRLLRPADRRRRRPARRVLRRQPRHVGGRRDPHRGAGRPVGREFLGLPREPGRSRAGAPSRTSPRWPLRASARSRACAGRA